VTRRWYAPLGVRLAAAFVVVAIAAVAVLATLTLVVARNEVSDLVDHQHARDAHAAAATAGESYQAARGWDRADLTPTAAIAAGGQATLIITDAAGRIVAAPADQLNRMMADMHGVAVVDVARGARVTAPVVVNGHTVGNVALRFPTSHLPGPEAAVRDALSRTALLGGLLALVVAGAVAAFVARRVARPVTVLTDAAMRLESGQLDVRVDLPDAPGELGTLAATFNRMAAAVEREDELRRRLVADIAHELRTPLTILRGTTEALVDGVAEPDPATLASLHEEVLRLTGLIGDLETLAAADAAGLRLDLRPVDLAEVVRTTLEVAAAATADAHLQVDTDLERAVVVGDTRRLQQIVTNLIVNAMRYTPAGGTVTVRTGVGEGHAFCVVADTGPGLADDEADHVFERFWRGRAARGTTGSGVGLAVVAELVAAHGGTITVGNRTDASGAVFTLQLPAEA
jgi:two-component system, OmpR family, sensor histidine kinase BaeS